MPLMIAEIIFHTDIKYHSHTTILAGNIFMWIVEYVDNDRLLVSYDVLVEKL